LSEDYEIGRGKPPEAGKIRAGEVRNPFGRKGRPKATANLMNQVLGETVRIREGDKEFRASKWEASFRALVLKALKGDVRAQERVYRTALKYDLVQEQREFSHTFRFFVPNEYGEPELVEIWHNDNGNRTTKTFNGGLAALADKNRSGSKT
jgi:hypothetical protein